MLSKWQVKKLGFQRLKEAQAQESFWNILWGNCKIRQEEEKSTERTSKKLEMTNK